MSTVSGCAEPDLIFDCPVCGVHWEGPLLVTVSADPVQVFPRWEVAPGMWVEDLSQEPRLLMVNQRVATAACRCVFSSERWTVDLEPGPGGKPGTLLVYRKLDLDRASAASPGTG
jgi:hypothetical protein